VQQWTYLIALLFSLLGLGSIDWRHKLAFFSDARRTVYVLTIALVFFVLWDLAGIRLGIFRSGHSAWMSGFYLAPQFPVEELFFLFLLNYLALLIFRGMQDGCTHIPRPK